MKPDKQTFIAATNSMEADRIRVEQLIDDGFEDGLYSWKCTPVHRDMRTPCLSKYERPYGYLIELWQAEITDHEFLGVEFDG